MSNELAKNNNGLDIVNPAIVKAAESATIMQSVAQETALLPTDEEYRYKLPRLGKVRIGIKVETQNGKQYPKAVDYFVLPEVLRNDKDFIQALVDRGIDPEKPKALPIMLLRNGIGEDVVSSYDLYGSSRGLVCRSYDHRTCQRVNPKTSEIESIPCTNENCPDWNSKKCRCITRIRFMLPDAMGIGVWQLDTSSVNSRTSILCELMAIKQAMGGKLAGIDLLMTLEPQVYHITQTEKDGRVKIDTSGNTSMMATTAHILHIRSAFSMRKAQDAIANAHEFDGAESVDMDYEGDAVIEPESAEVDHATGEVIEQKTATPEPVIELATEEQLQQIKSFWTIRFGVDHRAGNEWASGVIGKRFVKSQLTSADALLLLEAIDETVASDDATDAEYTEYPEDAEADIFDFSNE